MRDPQSGESVRELLERQRKDRESEGQRKEEEMQAQAAKARIAKAWIANELERQSHIQRREDPWRTLPRQRVIADLLNSGWTQTAVAKKLGGLPSKSSANSTRLKELGLLNAPPAKE